MRLAADRVIAALRKLDYAGAPLWQQAQQRLLARLTAPAAGGSTAGIANEDASASGGDDDAPVDVEQLGAAVAAAAATGPAVALEEEGLPYVEPKPKVGRAAGGMPLRGLPLIAASDSTGWVGHYLHYRSQWVHRTWQTSVHVVDRRNPKQVSVTKSDNLIDVSDLHPALPR